MTSRALLVFTLGGEAIGRVRPDEAVEVDSPCQFQVNMDKPSCSTRRAALGAGG